MNKSMTTIEKVQTLQDAFPFWNKLTVEQLDMIQKKAVFSSIEKGNPLISGFCECAGMLAVLSGSLRVYMLSEDGKEITLFRIGAGELCVLSASCVLSSLNFHVNIDAAADSEIIQLPSDLFAKLVQNNIYVEAFTYRKVSERFSDVMWALQQILFKSFDQRLASFLINESREINSTRIKITHEEIAKYTGSAREVVTRMLHYFAEENLVRLGRGSIEIIDLKGLEKIIS